MFRKKIKESDKVEADDLAQPTIDWGLLKSDEAPFFKSIKSLIYEAESQFEAQELQLCDDILSVVIKHIRRNRMMSSPIISMESLTDLINKNDE